MSAIAFTTKRKLNNAVKMALADRKIPNDAFDLYRDGSEIGIIWRELRYSAPIRARHDGTIYVGHADPYESGSIFERGLCDFKLLA
ncbi:MAG: hypothetical protein E6R03_10055 [Hyphomicrobiaceae bacterium]|nr:MAG: hypothetical protein E6R03_10055 [Hyphomicrobiaceae bacterium]